MDKKTLSIGHNTLNDHDKKGSKIYHENSNLLKNKNYFPIETEPSRDNTKKSTVQHNYLINEKDPSRDNTKKSTSKNYLTLDTEFNKDNKENINIRDINKKHITLSIKYPTIETEPNRENIKKLTYSPESKIMNKTLFNHTNTNFDNIKEESKKISIDFDNVNNTRKEKSILDISDNVIILY